MSEAKTYSTKDLIGTRVVGGKDGTKRIGKVRRFVFHPTEKRVVGFIVKRPDVALMFRRKDLFVALDGFDWEDGRIRLPDDGKDGTGAAACKRLGLDWDRCTLWEGMPILTMGGEECGYVGDVTFLRESGKIVSFTVEKGAMNKALLGTMDVPASFVKGFRTGIGGVELNVAVESGEGEGEALRGAILVSDDVLDLAAEGGLAQKAGEGAARAHAHYEQAKAQAKPKMHEAAKATEEAVNKGSFMLGRQIGRSKGMFKAFKDEYDRAVADDEPKKLSK
ncbi:PRC-barrel domain-containing protein [Curtanaerobium respiraculi]|uniref:PRC-barrel domain-containing protein n=1 Tax=Curtanaerobium respiraculi TaxID=2949669 RepID=UPI0024B3AB7D|nr:PRC-barrel domain-containing protein [Curtanaerobium respiraculi]